MSMPSTQIAMREGYIAEDEQTKPEMLMQPIALRVSSASRSKTRSIAVMSALKRRRSPVVAFVLVKPLNLPPTAIGVVALLARMPTDANAYIFAVQYQRLVNPVSGAVALWTLLAAVTLPAVVWWWRGEASGAFTSTPNGLAKADNRSAQAQEREHRTNHDN